MESRRLPDVWLIITSHDKHQFNVRGPIQDDTDVTNRVADLQKAGHRINCHTAPVIRGERREDVARRYADEIEGDYTFTDDPLDEA